MARPNPVDPDFPGIPRPGTFRPQGLNTLSTAFLSTGPGTWSVDQGSAYGVRPSGPCSSRPAVPLSGPRLSCRFSASTFAGAGATPEVNSDREGERKPLSEENDRRTLPSWVFGPFRAFSFAALGPASRSEPLLPFRPEVLPTFPLPGGAPRDCEQRKRLASLETACPPGVSHLSVHARVFGPPPPLAYGFTSARRPLWSVG